MAEKIKLNFKDIGIYLSDFRKKISRSFFCIEFGFNYINIGEAYYSKNKVNFRKVKRVEVPKEALDKGIPTDPEAMGTLILDLIKEEKINSKRAAIVISSDAVYTRLINIPKSIKERKVYEFLCDPKSSVQIPIQLNQSDFTIYKNNFINNEKLNDDIYFLTAIPKVSIDNLIMTCKNAEVELCYLESGFNSVIRVSNFSKILNKEKSYLIILELKEECTHLTIANHNGPLKIDRLTSIRNYPLVAGIVNSSSEEKYLPISKYDLKVLVREIKISLRNFFKNYSNDLNFNILLSGRNSSHPNLTKTLGECINLPIYLISTGADKNIGSIKFKDDNVYETNFTRLIGLGLGITDIKNDVKNNINNTLIDFADYYLPKKQTDSINKINSYKNLDKKDISNRDLEIKSSTKNLKINNTIIDEINFKNNKTEELQNKKIKESNKEKNYNQKNKNDNFQNDISDSSKTQKSLNENDIAEKKVNNSEFKLNTDFLDID